ncbi:uncharacterized protein LOC112346022 [Selaginella moellendorffii]|uniref:uncharacterized protein LOC112346022 n=1 Tax=Selaginella moellendorffii TaxID=88036 RepID=UPI000D1CB3DD|nr:uncharacterized protein LOC112346022 [Selaginella moellendorffii]|eukprot:XP_024529710.1 uncharacterized protein LOC112346022 [Selaginella moellendorffii]
MLYRMFDRKSLDFRFYNERKARLPGRSIESLWCFVPPTREKLVFQELRDSLQTSASTLACVSVLASIFLWRKKQKANPLTLASLFRVLPDLITGSIDHRRDSGHVASMKTAQDFLLSCSSQSLPPLQFCSSSIAVLSCNKHTNKASTSPEFSSHRDTNHQTPE